MSLLDYLNDPRVWNAFYEYKESLAVPKQFTKKLRAFIDGEGYRGVTDSIRAGEPFPLPEKKIVSKLGSEKKRVVYTYPEAENTVLKLLTWLLLRRYDGIFSKGLYSFRPGRTAKDAVRHLLRSGNVFRMYGYKVDIHDYFNSVPVERLLPMLGEVLVDDAELFAFLSSLLTEPGVTDRGRRIEEKKGIMAGTPLSAFFANLFLSDLDRHFADPGIPYVRYSDDVILFAETESEREEHARFVLDFLAERDLDVNPAKEERFSPGEGFSYLGFFCSGDKVDIAPVSVRKMKQKMRRKRDALERWRKRNGLEREKAARAFIRVFNRKLLEAPDDHELSWCSWFFPLITTAESLHEIDLYAQDCIRCLMSGTHTKARFNVRYEDLKRMGYRSLVHEYYGRKDE